MFKNFKVNWKTSVGGLVGAVVFIAAQQGVEVVSVNTWGEVVGIIFLALGLSQSKDGDKSTENQG